MEQELLLGVPELWPGKYLRGRKKKCCTINLFEQVKSKVFSKMGPLSRNGRKINGGAGSSYYEVELQHAENLVS